MIGRPRARPFEGIPGHYSPCAVLPTPHSFALSNRNGNDSLSQVYRSTPALLSIVAAEATLSSCVGPCVLRHCGLVTSLANISVVTGTTLQIASHSTHLSNI